MRFRLEGYSNDPGVMAKDIIFIASVRIVWTARHIARCSLTDPEAANLSMGFDRMTIANMGHRSRRQEWHF